MDCLDNNKTPLSRGVFFYLNQTGVNAVYVNQATFIFTIKKL